MRTWALVLCLFAVPAVATAQDKSATGRQIAAEVLYVQYTSKGSAVNWEGAEQAVRENLTKLQQQGTLKIAQTFRLSTMEGQKATMQIGETKAIVTGERFGPRGRMATHSFQNFGTIATVQGRVGEDKSIVLTVMFAKSGLSNAPKDGTPAGTLKTTAQTTLKLTPSRWMTASSSANRSGATTTHTLVLVRASAGSE